MAETKFKNISEALLDFQKEVHFVAKSKSNKHFGNAYAPLEEIEKVIHGPLVDRGIFYVIETVDICPEGKFMSLVFRFTHMPTATDFTTRFALPLAKYDPQGGLSTLTYAKRGALIAALGLSADEEDSDGEAAMPPEKKERKREKPAAKKEGEKKSDARILRLAAGMKMLNEKLSKVGGGLKMTDKDIKGYGRGFFGKESRKDWTDEEFEEVRLWIVKCLETGSIYDPIAYRESIQ